MSGAAISIVIPVRAADGTALDSLTERIRDWERSGSLEVIVVSAEPNEVIRRISEQRGCRYVDSTPCRGTQLHRGAVEATAEVLWFLHADAEPRRGSLAAISETIADGAAGGYFRFEFHGECAWRKTLLAGLVNLRTRLGGVPYGDQGIFVRREAYFDAGGFAQQPLFEEVSLVRKLRRLGHFRALALPIGVAARRWERDGWWYRSLMNRGLAIRYLLGVPAERLAGRYERTPVTNDTNDR